MTNTGPDISPQDISEECMDVSLRIMAEVLAPAHGNIESDPEAAASQLPQPLDSHQQQKRQTKQLHMVSI